MRWLRQPQPPLVLDSDHPWSKDIVGFFDPFNSRFIGPRVNVANSGDTASIRTGIPGVGKGTASAGSQFVQFNHHPEFAILGDLSIGVVFDADTLGSYSALVTKEQTTTANVPYELRAGAGPSDTNFEMMRANASGYQAWDGAGSRFLAGDKNIRFIVTAPSGIQNQPTGYINGTSFAMSTSAASGGTPTGAAGDDGSSKLMLGTRPDAVTYLNGGIYLVMLWRRQLSNSEAIRWTINPWDMFWHPARRLFFFGQSAGGGDQNISVSDTSAGSDALAIAVGLALGDTGSGADSLAGAAAVPIVDSGSAVDVIAATASLSITDVGAAGDALTIAVALAVADTGTGADAVTVITATLISIADALAGTDSLTISAAAALSDTGAGVDATQVAAALSVADSGAGTDAVSVITTTLIAIADSAAGTDALAIAVQVQLSDTGFATELLAITALVSVLETASGMDVAVRFDAQLRIATVTFSATKRTISFTI